MKTGLTIILLFAFACLFCQVFVFAELTENDIRRIVREELEPIKIEITELKVTVSEMDKRINEKFKAVEDKISLIQWFIGLLVAIVVAAIAIPQLLILYREKKESKEIDELRDIIAELKGKKVIMP